ncbi:hypothetical protein [Mesorhizobium sp. B2-6-1]|uniref:hypothetical protein n=1 Tax=Mesorhizobium sp. B2-6-1 TaxID=2589916 RepID=UPI00112CA7C3|nr:hypothetical protein [Mesorhizobium sp. B2-6-1]TPJ58658.1 hypothetical protein FJ443_25445 [Mesorhizobium sp. B2-6-1]
MAWDVLNAEILAIWREHFAVQEEGVLAPLFYPDHGPPELLFVGFNPSFKIEATQARAPDVDVGEFYRWREFIDERIPKMQDIQHRFLEDFPYFAPMREIAEHVGMKWAHLDLYPWRNTNQQQTIDFLDGRPALKLRLDRLFEATIRRLKPAIIVVANAYASKCFKLLFEGHLPFDDKVGFHRLEMDSKPTAVFFSSMLTGQRALDTGSLERLRWHVRKAAEGLKPARALNGDRSRHMSWGAGDVEFD